MKLAKISVVITALVYLIIGLMFLTVPNYWVSDIDIVLNSPTAVMDVRATYGGCMFAIGVFLVYWSTDLKNIRIGLIFQAISLAGFAFGRVLGFFVDGIPKPIMFYLLLAEISGIILAVYCLRHIEKENKI